MLRTTTPALIAVSLLAAMPRHAAGAAQPVAVVTGLADGDLLNIRATASAFGKVRGRLPNGATLEVFGCSDVGGYTWCRVEETGNPGLNGWAPARYLYTSGEDLPATTDIASVEQAAPREAPQPAQTSPAFDALTQGANGDNIFVPGQAPDAGQPGERQPRAAAPPALPADLTARFGEGADHAAQPAPAPAQSAATIGLTAAADAYGLAVSRGAAAEGDAGAPPEADGPAGTPTAEDAAVPLPTPRPAPAETEAAGEIDAQVVGEVQPPPAALAPAAQARQTAPQSTDEIPCARYVGQPMTHCAAVVVREGADAADVTVTWPDGGTRLITFRDGKPAGSNSRGEFRYTREGTLNMIRIGLSERFEITDAVPFGD